jgi:hypothetical protein
MAFVRKISKYYYLYQSRRDKRSKKIRQRVVLSLGKTPQISMRDCERLLTSDSLQRVKEKLKTVYGTKLTIKGSPNT